MSFNIATFSAKFGITDSVDTDFSRILSTIDRHSQSAADKLSNPIAALDRQAQMLEKSLDKTINKFGTGLVSEKALSDLEKMQTYVQNIYRQLSETGKIGDQGFLQAIQRLQTLQHGIDVARNIAVPSPSAFAALQSKAIAPAASAMPMTNTYSQFVGAESVYTMPAGFGPIKFGGNAYVDNDARNRHAVAARRDRAAYEQWWQNQQIAPQTTSRFVPNSDFGMPAGFGPLNLATDLDPVFNQHQKRLSVIGRNADIIIRRHQESKPFFTEQEEWNSRLKMADERNRNPYAQNAQQDFTKLQLSLTKDRIAAYEQEEKAVQKFARVYSNWSAEERRIEQGKLQIFQQNGIDRSARLKGLEQAHNNQYGMNRNTNPAFRYISQNVGFGIEDFLISSQYGGYKAGFRAITNNLTAIASAATSNLNPLIGTAAITGTALAGVGIPLAIGMSSGTDEFSEDLTRRMAQPSSANLMRQRMNIAARQAVGGGVGSARQAYMDSQDAIRTFEIKSQDINRAVTSRTVTMGSQNVSPSEWMFAPLRSMGVGESWIQGNMKYNPLAFLPANAVDYWSGNSNASGNRRYRTVRELGELSEARTLLDEANKNQREAGDPELLRQQMEQSRRLLEQERAREQSDFEITNRFTLERMKISGRTARGELVDPSLAYNISNQERNARLAQARKDYADQPERLKDTITQHERDQSQADAKHVHDMEMYAFNKQQQQFGFQQSMLSLDPNQLRKEEKAYQLRRQMTMQDASLTQSQKDEQLAGLEADYNYRVKQRGYAHESRMNDYEIRPIERMRKQYELRRKMLSEDSSLTQAQRDSELAGLDKQYQRSIRDIGERAPTLMGMDVGSLSDVANRNKYFNRNPTMEDGQRSFSEQLLRQVIEAINNQTLEMKKNKTPVKGFK